MEIDVFKQINPRLYKKLLQRNITQFVTILLLDTLELHELLNIPQREVEELKIFIANLVGPEERLGDVPDTRITTGCDQINKIICDGLPTARTIEIYGSAGSGKTQFCLQLLLTVQFPLSQGGLNKSAVYICTEPPFPSKRFHELCQLAPERFQIPKQDFENNVFVNICYNTDDFFTCISEKLPKLMEKREIGLIIIDTIAALFRGDEKEVNYLERRSMFYKIVGKLRFLATKHDAVLVFVNQVTENPETNKILPALGKTWAGLPLIKFHISRREFTSSTRVFSVVKSHESKQTSVEFNISKEGIV